MIEFVTKENLDEYEAFIASHKNGLFYHSSKWAKVKHNWKWEAAMVRDKSGAVRGSVSALIRFLPAVKYGLVYCCRGFCCDSDDFETTDELFQALKQIAKRNRGYVIKIDPEISIENTAYSNHLRELGFQRLPSGKNFENIQPNFVYCLDIDGMKEEEMLQHFHSKTRYNIRLAARKGVEVKICGKEMLPAFTELMRETGARDGFSTRPTSYFENILDALGDDCRLYMAFYEGKPVAGTIAIRFSHTMKYQYGASSNQYRNVMPNYLLQWNMIKWAIESGNAVYDFGGISGDTENEDNPLYGLYRFKRGFNGYTLEFTGEYDYVTKPLVYKLFNLADNLRKKLR